MKNDNHGDAFDEGYEALRDGVPEHENPYEAGTDESMDWFDGWNAADSDQDYDDSCDEDGDGVEDDYDPDNGDGTEG